MPNGIRKTRLCPTKEGGSSRKHSGILELITNTDGHNVDVARDVRYGECPI